MTIQRTKCTRVTRCVGYLRPVDQMNEGKQAEVNDRTMFNIVDGKNRNTKKC